jgi:hypothetical protein
VWVVVPLLPEMVMVRVPVVALRLAVILMVDVPAPVIDVGLKLMVVPLAWPEADNEMAEEKPPVTADVMVTLPELLRATVMDAGAARREKPGAVPVTMSDTVVVVVVVPEVPVTRML